MTFGAMLGAAALLVSTSLPANALFSAAASPLTDATASVTAQKLDVDTAVVIGAPTRDAYTVVSAVQKVVAVAKYVKVTRGNAYTNDPNGTIQWPFPDAVQIASGFGARSVPNCGYCSTFHEGLDFTPGAGVPIHAIADGVVSVAETGGAFGNHVVIDHVINGQKVQSLYAHMAAGSISVTVGQPVTVTQQLGLVGSTGASTGAHLHLEIHLGGTPVDPFAWLKANAN